MSKERCDRIEEILSNTFAPSELVVRDQSHLHAGHAGARDGKGHFAVDIVSRSFAGLSRIECHRRVFEALGDMMETDIHALKIRARASDKPNSL